MSYISAESKNIALAGVNPNTPKREKERVDTSVSMWLIGLDLFEKIFDFKLDQA